MVIREKIGNLLLAVVSEKVVLRLAVGVVHHSLSVRVGQDFRLDELFEHVVFIVTLALILQLSVHQMDHVLSEVAIRRLS